MAVPAMTIEGDVIAAHSYWTDDQSRIVTEATVRAADGQEVVVSQLGGSVDGIGMIQMPGMPILEPGMHVAVAAHGDLDLAQQEHVVLDSVKVMAYPPGFVRTGPTKAGHYLKWESGCVLVTIDAAGTTAIAGDAEFPFIDAAIATWNNATVTPSCSYLDVMNDGRKSLEVGNDKVNLIKFRDTTWGRPAVGNDPARMYNMLAAGITTAVFVDDASSSRDGAILDADIELNGVYFDISISNDPMVMTGPRGKCVAQLQNTLTHELGHLHGLEHPCLADGDPPRVDDQGNAVPTCADVQANRQLPQNQKILNATMYNFQTCGEVSKERLSDDEIQGMCKIYPTAQDPGTCDPVGTTSGGGCCSASGRDRADSTLFVAGLTFLLLRRRRRAVQAA